MILLKMKSWDYSIDFRYKNNVILLLTNYNVRELVYEKQIYFEIQK